MIWTWFSSMRGCKRSLKYLFCWLGSFAEMCSGSPAARASFIAAGLLAPWVGYISESVGRKPLLLVAFAVEAVRAALLGLVSNYTLVVLAQVLGGITSAIIGVMTVLVVTDLTTGTGRFNLTRGAVVTLSTIAASLSVAVSGFIFQGVGQFPTFAIFAGVAATAALVAWFFLPETKPAEYLD